MKNKILFKIIKHFDDNYIWINYYDVNLIYNDVLSGVYAFKIIYNDSLKYGVMSSPHIFRFEKYSHLDYRLIKEDNINPISTLISIDGGERYQWNKREVLFIDPVEIRDLKLKEIGI
jgi:hypothetical protein